MKRADLLKRLRSIARDEGVELTSAEGRGHTKVMFDGRFVTTVPRHREINEHTARGAIHRAKNWRS